MRAPGRKPPDPKKQVKMTQKEKEEFKAEMDKAVEAFLATREESLSKKKQNEI